MSTPNQAEIEREPRWKLFRKTRGGVALTREQVKEIKKGRKELRKEMKERKIYSKYEFETTASTLGLYFDKKKGFLIWLFSGGRGIWVLIGAALLTMLALFGMATVSQMRGYFTVNLSDKMYKQGFVLSETSGFDNPVSYLFSEPREVHCVSILTIPQDIGDYDGQYDTSDFFAYTHYVRNEGDMPASFTWELEITGESKELSRAVWAIVIEDGELSLFAEANQDGSVQVVPDLDDNTRGYLDIPVMSMVDNPDEYLEPVKVIGSMTYNRVVTKPFTGKYIISSGLQSQVLPGEVHKYTVVLWLEGDDPDCTDELIGGHLGVSFKYAMVDEEEEQESFLERLWNQLTFWEERDDETFWQNIWESLKFWEK